MRSEVFARNQCLIKRKGIIIEELQRGMLTRETFIAFIEGSGRLLYKARGGEIWMDILHKRESPVDPPSCFNIYDMATNEN